MANIVIKSKKHGKKSFTAQQSTVQSSSAPLQKEASSLLSKAEQAEVHQLQGQKTSTNRIPHNRKVQEALRSSGILPKIAKDTRLYAQVNKVLASYTKGIRGEGEAREALGDHDITDKELDHIFSVLSGNVASKVRNKQADPISSESSQPNKKAEKKQVDENTGKSGVGKKPGLEKLRKMYQQAEAQDVSAKDILTNLSSKKPQRVSTLDGGSQKKVSTRTEQNEQNSQANIPKPKRIPIPGGNQQAVAQTPVEVPKPSAIPKPGIPPQPKVSKVPKPVPANARVVAPHGVVKPVSIKEPGQAQKPTISDVTPPRSIPQPSGQMGVRRTQLTGPLDELRQMDLVTFRRLHDTVEIRIQKLSEKLSLLEQQHYPDRLKGIQAWKESPLFTEYVSLGYESLYEGKPLEEVLGAHGGSSLSMKEFIGILDFNKSLGY